MIIEAGNYYKLKIGSRVYVCSTQKPNDFPIIGWDDVGRVFAWTNSGKFHLENESDYDIVSEWRDELQIPWDELFLPWVKWFAVDSNGSQTGFELRPRSDRLEWYAVGDGCGYVVLPPSKRIPFTGDWKKSLIERK